MPAAPRRRGTGRCGTVSRSVASSPAQLSAPLVAPTLGSSRSSTPSTEADTARARPHRKASARQASGSELSHRALAGVLGGSRCQVKLPDPPAPYRDPTVLTQKYISGCVVRPPTREFSGVAVRRGHILEISTTGWRFFAAGYPLHRANGPILLARQQPPTSNVGPSTSAPGDGREGQGVLA